MTVTSGILAALAAPLAMTLGFVIWDKHWKGSAFALNMYKCTVASFGFLLLSVVTRAVREQEVFPSHIFTTQSVGFLVLSSTIGILIGDWTWLEALRLIGATRVIVVDTCKPFLAALFGWTILGEALPPGAFGGMALTVVGVLVVSLEKERGTEDDNEHDNVDDKINDTERSIGTEKDYNNDSEEQVVHTKVDSDDDGDKTVVFHPNDHRAISIDTSSSSILLTSSQQQQPKDESRTSKESLNENSSKQESSLRRPILSRVYIRGYTFAFLNVVLDTYGSLLTKEYGQGMTTWEINLIRFGFAGASMLSLSLFLRLHNRYSVCKEDKDKRIKCDVDNAENGHSSPEGWYLLPTMKRRNWIKVSMGVLLVTFLCPALSNYALFQIALALALTLGSIGPLYALPLAWALKKERPSWRSCLGAALAVGGVVILSLLGTSQ